MWVRFIFCVRWGSAADVLDGETLALAYIPAGIFPQALTLDILRNKIYAADFAGKQIVIIDGLTNTTESIHGVINPSGVDCECAYE